MPDERLTVVSNRLPVTFNPTTRRLSASGGGLVTALLPILNRMGGSWIGSMDGQSNSAVAQSVRESCSSKNYSFTPVFLTPEENAGYYEGFSNEIIWPLFHGLPSRCQFSTPYWNMYSSVNAKFADAIERTSWNGDFIWVHDYHLMTVAEILRRRGLSRRLAYFHHIPFPCPDVFEALPWRVEILRALMNFDLIGFQTLRDSRNFVACLEHCLPDVQVDQAGERLVVRTEKRRALVGTYPISIDYAAFSSLPMDSSVTSNIESIRRNGQGRIIVGVDRLDYTKGIPQRLIGFQTLLERNAELRGKVALLQIVFPSRENIPEYERLRLGIETLVSKINGKHSTPGWIPIHYFNRSFSQSELVTFYRAADIAAVTPLRDGMNLVAKEFCASRTDQRGVLVLSEFAGAAEELKCGALLVNPNDSDALATAFGTALRMEDSEQQRRMQAMQCHLRIHDVFHWAESFIATARLDRTVREHTVSMAV